MLSRLAFRCSSRFTLNEPIAVGERDSTEPLRPASGAPSTTAHRGLKTGRSVGVGVLPPYRANPPDPDG
jgi:hypothetical protein